MNTPKMLPWLAGTAGIDLERAEQLWQSASDYAESITGESDSAHYLSIAHEHMVALVEKEVLDVNSIQDAPWLLIQAHLSVAPMIVADTFAQAAASASQAIGRWKQKHHIAA
ncbi:MAG: hypothetical protein WAO76_01765 [Georgfuchsia sp.]